MRNDNIIDNTLKIITLNGVLIFSCTYFVLSVMLSFLGCYHLCTRENDNIKIITVADHEKW